MIEIIKEILFWITTAMGIFLFYKFLQMSKVLDKNTMRMIKQVSTMWGSWMRGQRENPGGNPATTPIQLDARKKVADNIRSHPLLGTFTKGLADNEIFGLITDADLLKGIGVTADMGIALISKISGLIGIGKSKESRQQRDEKGFSYD